METVAGVEGGAVLFIAGKRSAATPQWLVVSG